jgi:phospholipid/cholesterol/gamma-HCH transport system permease protein
MPDVAPVERALRGMVWPARSALVFEASGIEAFDTGGAVVLYRALMEARRQGCEVSIQGLRPDYAQLMSLVSSHWAAMVAEVASRSERE